MRADVIRLQGLIQSHGVFLAADPDTLAISHISDNSESLIGFGPAALLGRPLTDILGADELADLRRVLSGELANPTTAEIAGRQFDVISSRSGRHLFVELEPRMPTEEGALAMIRDVLRNMSESRTKAELWDRAARGMRKITGYDRVNIAYFHPDGHGEVVGAAQADEMESHLGLHFPASNIPDQPSGHYLTKRSRLIVDSRSERSDLLVDSGASAATDLDLSGAILAAPSARDLGLIQNLGHVSTFSLALVRAGVLLGVITCAHRAQRRLGYSLREGLEILADQLSLQLAAMEEIDRLGQRDAVRLIRSQLVAQISDENDIVDALLHRERTILDLVPADGAVVRLNGRLEAIGRGNDPDFIASLAGVVATLGDFSSAAIPSEYPGLAPSIPGVAGMLVRRLGSAGDFIAWFRRETRYAIEWIDDLSARDTPPTPSGAPRIMREIGSGTCAPWIAVESEATELSRTVEGALLNRARAELANLALRDPLTGLLNRRALEDALDRRLTSDGALTGLALLFIDIDEFKSINDRFGHAAGDAALMHVALNLHSVAREDDIVARFGGDEFVVVIDGVDQEAADRIAARLVAAIQRAPADGSRWRVRASVGLAFAQPQQDASNLLDAADAAMFRAKLRGRNRASR